jgi:exonuclease III
MVIYSVVKYIRMMNQELVGPRIDMIISSTKLSMNIGVVEVSGAVNKVDKTHFQVQET